MIRPFGRPWAVLFVGTRAVRISLPVQAGPPRCAFTPSPRRFQQRTLRCRSMPINPKVRENGCLSVDPTLSIALVCPSTVADLGPCCSDRTTPGARSTGSPHKVYVCSKRLSVSRYRSEAGSLMFVARMSGGFFMIVEIGVFVYGSLSCSRHRQVLQELHSRSSSAP